MWWRSGRPTEYFHNSQHSIQFAPPPPQTTPDEMQKLEIRVRTEHGSSVTDLVLPDVPQQYLIRQFGIKINRFIFYWKRMAPAVFSIR